MASRWCGLSFAVRVAPRARKYSGYIAARISSRFFSIAASEISPPPKASFNSLRRWTGDFCGGAEGVASGVVVSTICDKSGGGGGGGFLEGGAGVVSAEAASVICAVSASTQCQFKMP